MKIFNLILNIITLVFFGYEVFNYFAHGNILGMIFFLFFLVISGWSMLNKMRKISRHTDI